MTTDDIDHQNILTNEPIRRYCLPLSNPSLSVPLLPFYLI